MMLTDAAVRRLKAPTTGQVDHFDQALPGFGLRISAGEVRSWFAFYRVNGKQRRETIGRYPAVTLADARKRAAAIFEAVRGGADPKETRKREKAHAEARRFEVIVEAFLTRHASRNRTADETRRVFERYVLPTWRGRQIDEISRRDVAELLDKVEDCRIDVGDGRMLGGPVMADRTLAAIRKLFNWYAARDDRFVSPVVRGMSRTKPKDRARDRVLSDAEIRALWPLLDDHGIFGAIVRLLFLTAQRRDEVASMRRSEISGDVWTIPAARYKTNRANVIPLSSAALEVINRQPRLGGSDLMFTTSGRTAFSGFSKAKRKLDEALSEAEQPWTLHDIRRTARTLMTRAGVRPDIAERVLGHVIAGVEGVYDRHGYEPEKRQALEALATMIERIVDPPADNVVSLPAKQ
ncbi:MAG: integrase arm-type DNA-binding domain-containing protein [Rhodospirillales bacterium]|nr:integrase arm-type DNA-binding domain-containing protein [Rhodospirillales bacterium]